MEKASQIIIAVLAIFSLLMIVDKCSTPKPIDTSALDMAIYRLKQDSIRYRGEQQRLRLQIDSISNAKQQTQIRYVTKIRTIAVMPDHIIDSILTAHLDSLYTHRFNSFKAE